LFRLTADMVSMKTERCLEDLKLKKERIRINARQVERETASLIHTTVSVVEDVESAGLVMQKIHTYLAFSTQEMNEIQFWSQNFRQTNERKSFPCLFHIQFD